jgi:hypothetical protein
MLCIWQVWQCVDKADAIRVSTHTAQRRVKGCATDVDEYFHSCHWHKLAVG